jgi:hypothetical protein
VQLPPGARAGRLCSMNSELALFKPGAGLEGPADLWFEAAGVRWRELATTVRDGGLDRGVEFEDKFVGHLLRLLHEMRGIPP